MKFMTISDQVRTNGKIPDLDGFLWQVSDMVRSPALIPDLIPDNVGMTSQGQRVRSGPDWWPPLLGPVHTHVRVQGFPKLVCSPGVGAAAVSYVTYTADNICGEYTKVHCRHQLLWKLPPSPPHIILESKSAGWVDGSIPTLCVKARCCDVGRQWAARGVSTPGQQQQGGVQGARAHWALHVEAAPATGTQ